MITRADRWLGFPIIFAVCVPLLIGVTRSFLGVTGASIPIQLLLVFTYLVCGAVYAPVAFYNLCRGLWRLAVSRLFLPALIAVFTYSSDARNIPARIADMVHFLILSPSYNARVAKVAPDGPISLHWFYWNDVSGFQDGETLVYLVYDESNEFGLPASQRSEEWLKRAQMTFTAQTNHSELPEFPDKARHLLGHYYVVDVYYG